ncbi:hypothetical protein NYR54_10055 [Chelativorans sp. SCAU2101]|jgi:hypothetical protein|uniref:Lipoprotein n=1 Tax=Chelativorans petroleitrophicus TaxID=2975484 RepID=A0A9X2X9H7_9HYPH|nr:hypothetical protein [Chelativorans petroleitrophicus]MCT8990631.1 hypothetical protein [Chelativorans petroleitrophicus]
MKIPGRLRPFSPVFLAAACLTPWLLAACASSSERAPGTQPDGYPNLNISPAAAAPQLTNEERRALVQELAKGRELPSQASQPSAAELERLRRLGELHAEERLRAIEAGE